MNNEHYDYEDFNEYQNIITLERKVHDSASRSRALRQAHRAAKLLADAFSPVKIILYGSLLDETLFDETSDIDLATQGIDEKDYLKALSLCHTTIPYPIDLVLLETSPQTLSHAIHSTGQVLYSYP